MAFFMVCIFLSNDKVALLGLHSVGGQHSIIHPQRWFSFRFKVYKDYYAFSSAFIPFIFSRGLSDDCFSSAPAIVSLLS